MTRPIFVYGLLSPRTKRIRYIGCSVNPKGRRYELDGNSGKLSRWVKKLVRQDQRPKHFVLAIAYNDHDAGFLEEFFKQQFLAVGFRLLNSPKRRPYKNWHNKRPGSRQRMKVFASDERVI